MNDIKNQIISSLVETIDDTVVWSPTEPQYFGPTTRSLALYTDIDNSSALLINSQLRHLAYLKPDEPITLFINTEGGSLTDALSIYDTIQDIEPPVICVATGLCASAGLLILAAGDYKAATKNTVFYYHQPVFTQSTFINSKKDMESLNGFYDYCQTTVDQILKDTMGISDRMWKKNFDSSTGFYFDTQKAIKFNLIDKIIKSNKLDFEISEEED